MSERGDNWIEFATLVHRHVEEYTVAQYGDAPTDKASDWTPEDCVKEIRKYIERFGKGQRGQAEQLRDCFKIAHVAELLYEKLEKDLRAAQAPATEATSCR